LADAAEELTFGVDNTEELGLKERKEKRSIDPDMIARVKLYQEMMALNGRFESLDNLASAIKAGGTAQRALEQAKEFFPDPADAYAALQELSDQAESYGLDPKVLKEAMAELDAASGPVIRASVAGALAGADFADLGGPLELKGDYVKAAIDFPDPLDMMGHVLDRFGADGFERGVDFLTKALAADLSAEAPSRDKTALESVSAQLGQIRVLNGVRSLGESLVSRWGEVHGQKDSALTALDFVKFVLEARRDNYPSAKLADPLVALAAPPDIEKEVLFRQDLLNSVKSVSIHALGDLEQRGRLMAAVQEGLDLAVAREDEMLAAMEDGY
jgi:type III secretion protein W